jgi:hypothetical protein
LDASGDRQGGGAIAGGQQMAMRVGVSDRGAQNITPHWL